jgi:hypothetical protein
MRSAIVRIDESRVEVELIDLVKFRPEVLGWHFRSPQWEWDRNRDGIPDHLQQPTGVGTPREIAAGK